MVRTLFASERGLISLAIRNNELRVEYPGTSVRTEIAVTYIVAAIAGGIGGVISGAAIGHVEPVESGLISSKNFKCSVQAGSYQSLLSRFTIIHRENSTRKMPASDPQSTYRVPVLPLASARYEAFPA